MDELEGNAAGNAGGGGGADRLGRQDGERRAHALAAAVASAALGVDPAEVVLGHAPEAGVAARQRVGEGRIHEVLGPGEGRRARSITPPRPGAGGRRHGRRRRLGRRPRHCGRRLPSWPASPYRSRRRRGRRPGGACASPGAGRRVPGRPRNVAARSRVTMPSSALRRRDGWEQPGELALDHGQQRVGGGAEPARRRPTATRPGTGRCRGLRCSCGRTRTAPAYRPRPEHLAGTTGGRRGGGRPRSATCPAPATSVRPARPLAAGGRPRRGGTATITTACGSNRSPPAGHDDAVGLEPRWSRPARSVRTRHRPVRAHGAAGSAWSWARGTLDQPMSDAGRR